MITGGGSGLGLECARAFLEHDAAGVFLLDLSHEALEKADTDLKADFPEALVLIRKVDVTDEAALHEAVDHAAEHFETIDILLPFAGNAALAGEENALSGWSGIIDVNLTGTYYTSVLFGDRMASGGSIIMVSSLCGHVNIPAIHPAYDASKAGVLSIKSALAEKYAPKGIRVNSVSPGFIETPLTKPFPQIYRDNITSKSLVPRFGTPQEVVPMVVLLASNAGSYITATDISIDGGYPRDSR